MPMRDLHLYQRYTARRGFPARRIELLLAQVALVLSRVNGNRHAELDDFLMDPRDEFDSYRGEPPAPDERDLSGFFD